jgi:schlafen family protein
VRNLALSDVTAVDLDAMLAENETLFVEHNGSIGDGAFQVAKAMCSFANTLGGWVLIGVTNGAPNAGLPDGWEPLAAADLTDRVREALKANRVDPIPAFAATVRDIDDKPIGIIRVYESADAPHVMGNGQVFVRSVAEDQDHQCVYRPGGVETQTVLVELVERGRRGEEDAMELLEKLYGPFLLREIGFQLTGGRGWVLTPGTIALRAVPITGARMQDWAVSARGKVALEGALRRLAGLGDDATVESVVNIRGLAAHYRGDVSWPPASSSAMGSSRSPPTPRASLGRHCCSGRRRHPWNPRR